MQGLADARTRPAKAPAEGLLAGLRKLGPGQFIGEYRIIRVLASGGFGTVYEAEHEILGRRAAIKVIHEELATSPKQVKRFIREAQAVNLIGHESIVDIYEFGTHLDGRPFFVMELLGGESLEELLRRRGRLSPNECMEIVLPVCRALSAAHAAGVVHRDLKAANVHVTTALDGQHSVKLLDFGIAKFSDRTRHGSLTSRGTTLGTPNAMAPEQVRGEPTDERTDVYALGVLVFLALTGRVPFRGSTPIEIEAAHCDSPIPAASTFAPVSPALDAILLCALAKKPSDRYSTVAAFRRQLQAAVARTETPARKGRRRARTLHRGRNVSRR